VPPYLFEGHSLDIDLRELKRGSEPVSLEPQVFDLLAYLVKNRDRVLTKDDLIAAVWGGRIVSESTLTSRINSARKAVGDSGGEQRLIRTYARKGFRFVGEVQEAPDSREPERASPGTLSSPIEMRGKPCIAVLPFVNLSGDPEQEYFSDGITEDIITALSKHRSLLVIARNSTFALKADGGDARRRGLDLGANYVVQGSVRRMGPRVRITAQLVDTTDGQTVWAEQYDRGLQEIFEVQDEITSTIAARLEPEIGNAERARADRKPPQTFDAWDFFRLGTKHFYKSTADDNREAQRLFRRAIELDPTLAEAYGFLSYSIVLSMIYFDAEPDDALLNEAVAIAKQGAELDDRDASIRFMYGRALLARKSYSEALDELEIAAELNPNLAVVYCGLGDSLTYEGRISEAIPYFQRAIDLSPHDPLRWAFYSYRALAHLFAREFELAEDWARKATRVPNCHYWGFSHRVAALGHMQRADELQAAVADLRRINPAYTCKLAQRRLFYVKDPSQVALYIEGLRQASVPES
jgi:TolB-like protein/Flp pilus assembly protein TadD